MAYTKLLANSTDQARGCGETPGLLGYWWTLGQFLHSCANIRSSNLTFSSCAFLFVKYQVCLWRSIYFVPYSTSTEFLFVKVHPTWASGLSCSIPVSYSRLLELPIAESSCLLTFPGPLIHSSRSACKTRPAPNAREFPAPSSRPSIRFGARTPVNRIPYTPTHTFTQRARGKTGRALSAVGMPPPPVKGKRSAEWPVFHPALSMNLKRHARFGFFTCRWCHLCGSSVRTKDCDREGKTNMMVVHGPVNNFICRRRDSPIKVQSGRVWGPVASAGVSWRCRN